jgi:hypothetical protein
MQNQNQHNKNNDLKNFVILNFFITIIQLITIAFQINFYNSSQKYTERQYLMFEKILEKQQELAKEQTQIIIQQENQIQKIENSIQNLKNISE